MGRGPLGKPRRRKLQPLCGWPQDLDRLVQQRHAGIALLERAEGTQCGAQRARRQFSTERGVRGRPWAALPSQLRRMLREQGRDLHAEFLRLLPERPRPIRIQRWSARRVGLLLLVVPLAALLALGFQQLPAGLAAVSFKVVRTRPDRDPPHGLAAAIKAA